ncbi:MAG: hypothetical protein SGBAC_005268 [Bacillariaceae sp.]
MAFTTKISTAVIDDDDFLFRSGGPIELPSTLRPRLFCRVPPSKVSTRWLPPSIKDDNEEKKEEYERTEGGRADPSKGKSSTQPFVLYLPTVVLRHRHNPGFSLACRLANFLRVPLLVLCTVLDDKHMTPPSLPNGVISSQPPIIAMTARKLAFTLEALQSCTLDWQSHGAGVLIRLHGGPGNRTPHHLTLAHQAAAVVTDEAFVEPYAKYMQTIVSTCHAAKVPCWTVDGSTSVPPKCKLKPVSAPKSDAKSPKLQSFTGVPAKAWRWAEQTKDKRKPFVYGATQQGHLNAPPLDCKLPPSFLSHTQIATGNNASSYHQQLVQTVMPLKKWRTIGDRQRCKGLCTVDDLVAISNLKEWAMTSWPGADTSVAPCQQTHGSNKAAVQRWEFFLQQGGLKNYAKKRNQIVLPHAVSRISCYLNLGILSIFDVLHDTWNVQVTEKGYATGCDKFLDEVVKWREIGYAYTFANPSDYGSLVQAIPSWAKTYLDGQYQQKTIGDDSGRHQYSYADLQRASTNDVTWNAMQSYLNEMGELHNNARMTWGKTVVHWQCKHYPPEQVLLQMCWLNDRYALDGLSPPSYAGILWCFGWGDKPGRSTKTSNSPVSTKWACNYRTGADGFGTAKVRLLEESPALAKADAAVSKRKREDTEELPSGRTRVLTPPKTKSIRSFFSPVCK